MPTKDRKQYYIDNMERIKSYAHQYRIVNKERIKLRDKQYNIDHKEEMLIKSKKRRLDNIEKYRKREREQRRKYNPELRKNNQLKKDFGITLEIYKEMFDKQNGRCAICENEFKILCIDHDHITDKIRGLLCNQCNLVLGNAKDNIFILENSINYLKRIS
jgi:hypothetical protein